MAICDPEYRMAAWIAMALGFFQQMCGLNALVLYSSNVFDPLGIDPVKGTVLINTLSWLTTPFTGMLLKCFGRRTMLVWAYIAMAVLGTGMSIAVLTDHNTIMLFVTCFFCIAF